MLVEKIGQGYSCEEYQVNGVEVEKMTDAALIDLCDRNNFGGRVSRLSPTSALVNVYID